MVQEKPPTSSRIALLEQALLAKNAAALDTFWQEVSTNDPLTDLAYGAADFGTRIVPDPLNPRQFVYPKDEEVPDD